MTARQRLNWTIVYATTVAAAVLRLHGIASRSFWIDEGASVAIARMDWYNFARLLWRREANMTLYYLLLRPWLHGGDSEIWVRGLSTMFALATVPVVYVLGRKLVGNFAGMAAAALLAVHAFHVRYSQEARAYTLVALLVTVASLLLVRALESPTRRRWWAYSIVAALAIYAQFFAVLVVIAHWLAARAYHGGLPETRSGVAPQDAPYIYSARPFLITLALALPIWIFVATTGTGPLRWVTRPNAASLLWFAHDFGGNVRWPGLLVWAAVLAAAALFMRARGRWPDYFVALWLVLPIGVTLAASFLRPVFVPRYLMVSLPALVLLGGAVAARIGRGWRWVALALLLLVLANGTRRYYAQDFDVFPEDWRDATRYVLQHAGPADELLFHANQGRMPFTYYANLRHASIPRIIFPHHGSEITWRDFMGSPDGTELEAAERHVAAGGTVWVLLSHEFGDDPVQADLNSRMKNFARSETDFPGVRVVRYSGR